MRLLWQTMDGLWYWRCYMVSKLNSLSLLTGKEVSIDLYRKFLKDMLSLWHDPKHGKMFTSWPKFTVPRWEENMGDAIIVNQINLFSARFWVNIFRGRPMVASIHVWDQFELDREDGTLTDEVFDDVSKMWHAIAIKWLFFYDSRRDQKKYSFTRKYLTNVKGLFKFKTVLEFIKL